MRDIFFGGLVLLAFVMLLIDLWPAIVGTPSVKCDGGEGQTEEDDLEAWLDGVWEKVSRK